MAVKNLTLEDVINMVESEGYTLDKRPEKLNIVGVRDAKDTQADTYDDVLAYFYFDEDGNVIGRVARGTTSPGIYWLKNPMRGDGTAILKSGIYNYKIGLHRRKYEALVQDGLVTVMRDNDRNGILNYFAPTMSGTDFGINIHKPISKSDEIYAESAGCQVFAKESDFQEMMTMAKRSRLIYGNNFKYILIDEKDTISRRINYAVIGLIFVGIVAYSYIAYKKILKK